MKHFHEKKIEAQKAAKASEMHQKRITGFIAKMIKTFWSNVEKACILKLFKPEVPKLFLLVAPF